MIKEQCKTNDQKNLGFPFHIENGHRYIMFLYINEILTDEEFDKCMERLKKKTRINWRKTEIK